MFCVLGHAKGPDSYAADGWTGNFGETFCFVLSKPNRVLNTGRHLEDSFTKGKKDTYLIPRVLYSSQAIGCWQLMQRVKASGGLERPANRSTERLSIEQSIAPRHLACSRLVPYSYVDWAHFEGRLYCTICGQFIRY